MSGVPGFDDHLDNYGQPGMDADCGCFINCGDPVHGRDVWHWHETPCPVHEKPWGME